MKLIRILLVVSITLLPWHGFTAERSQFFESTFNVTTASQAVTQGARTIMILQNLSDTVIWCNPTGGTAVVNRGIGLNPAPSAGQAGGAIVFDLVVPNTAVTCIHGGTGNKVLNVIVG